MIYTRRARLFTFGWLLLAGAALLAIGALQLRQEYLTRGLIEGLPEPILEGGVRLGINVNLEQYSDADLDSNLSAIRQIGFLYLKQPFFFNENFDWAASDRLISAVSAHELTLVPLLDGDPQIGFAPPNDPALYASWAGEFAARYGRTIEHYVIWDEPNLASHWGNQPVNPAEYAALLAAAARAIRAADADALIVAAPLAPTTEGGPTNLAEPAFLQQLYETGARDSFDIVAAKPYGFDTGPEDRTVDEGRLNFSRVILLREVMAGNGDAQKAIWAGNWGWNSLPDDWRGDPSLWGLTDESSQATRTVAAVERARREWPWMGVMFQENWQPNAPETDPRWGFSIAGRETAKAIAAYLRDDQQTLAFPGFHPAGPNEAAQDYQGGWRFSPDFGADISQSGDKVTFTFWGTDVGLRVRRANFRARLYVTIDGRSANALPNDERGSMLVLTSASPGEDYISTEWVARDLNPGEHTLTLVASRGWDQWVMNGFSVGYWPASLNFRWGIAGLGATAILALLMAYRQGRKGEWAVLGRQLARAYGQLNQRQQLAITSVAAAIVAAAGWLTWGQQAAGAYRRLGDGGQLALTAAAAAIFYVTPSFFVYAVALALLFLLIYFRPAWGLALVAFSFPFYVLPKPMLNYRFSPVEVFTLVTFAAFLLSQLTLFVAGRKIGKQRCQTLGAKMGTGRLLRSLHPADYAGLAIVAVATFSLLFTERLDVATNEWRVLILEPALFYLMVRRLRPAAEELWLILDAFVLGGLVIALYGLWQYGAGQNLITAEGGLMRLRSIYGSPNNVGLYLGRIFPLLLAMGLLGTPANGRRRWLYTLALLPVSLALLLSFSRGALFLGIPAATLFIFWCWQRRAGRRTWPWLILFLALGLAAILLTPKIPALAGRFDLRGATSFFRLNLWRASLNMIADHPLFGVGLDNFLYAYRGRYILDAAWQEPNLSHPHNLWLDFATRLGLLGLLAGMWLFWAFYRALRALSGRVPADWSPVAVGISGALADVLAHGLVDHGFFLVDLAFAFYLMLGAAVWLQRGHTLRRRRPQ